MDQIEFRCTRNKEYPVGTIGHKDQRARAGYYIFANCAADAVKEMQERFPKEGCEGFTVHEWLGADEIPRDQCHCGYACG